MDRTERPKPTSFEHPSIHLARQVPPSIQCEHRGEEVGSQQWAPVSQSYRNFYDHEENQDHHHEKKSILMKVKEKASKWRQVLAKKRHGHDEDNSTPPWGFSLDEAEEEDPEYHGAPMYESELAPNFYKQNSPYQVPASQFISGLHEKSDTPREDTVAEELEMKQTTDTHIIKQQEAKGMLPPNNNFSYAITGGGNSSNKKEYVMHKLQPGEDDRHTAESGVGKCREIDYLKGRGEQFGPPISISADPRPEIVEASGRALQAPPTY